MNVGNQSNTVADSQYLRANLGIGGWSSASQVAKRVSDSEPGLIEFEEIFLWPATPNLLIADSIDVLFKAVRPPPEVGDNLSEVVALDEFCWAHNRRIAGQNISFNVSSVTDSDLDPA
jgi:hypothetical protein